MYLLISILTLLPLAVSKPLFISGSSRHASLNESSLLLDGAPKWRVVTTFEDWVLRSKSTSDFLSSSAIYSKESKVVYNTYLLCFISYDIVAVHDSNDIKKAMLAECFQLLLSF